MFTLGVPEMVVIFILALVLFGPKKLPELGKSIGKAMTEFRRASNDLKATFEREVHSLEQENQSIQRTTRDIGKQLKSAVGAPFDPLKQELSSITNPESASATSGAPSSNGKSNTATAVKPTDAKPVETTTAEQEPAAVAANSPKAEAPKPALEGTVPRGTHGHPDTTSSTPEATKNS